MRPKIKKKIKILNGLIETIPMIPHVAGLGRNLRFSEIRGEFSRNIRGSGTTYAVFDYIASLKG